MRVFITGASGWIGSHTVDELLANGHVVVGMARSDASADSLRAKGADVLRGDLDDLDAISAGAEQADAVVHLANKHDWSNQAATNAAERAAAKAIGDALSGTDKPFVIASGTAFPNSGIVTEETRSPHVGPDAARGGSERLALDYVDRGVRTIVARFAPSVHGTGDHGFIRFIADSARKEGASLVAGDGSARWSAVHATDAARLIRLGLEHAPAGTVMHAVAEGQVRTGDIAAAIADGLGIPLQSVSPQELQERYGFIGAFFGMDIPANSDRTRALLGWEPTGPTLIEDIRSGSYFA